MTRREESNMKDNEVNIMYLYYEWKKGNIPFEPILEYYKPRIRGIAYKYARIKKYNNRIVYDLEDWLSHGYFACYDSCLKYKEDGNATLDTFVTGRLILEFNSIIDRKKYKKYDDSDFTFVALDNTSKIEGYDTKHEIHEIIADTQGLKDFKDIELEDLCKYYSLGDNTIAETYKAIVFRDMSLSDSARKQGLKVTTLTEKVKRHRVKLQKAGII